jgi:hypothetical protein
METKKINFELTKNETSKKCKCDYCHSTVEFDRHETTLFIKMMGWEAQRTIISDEEGDSIYYDVNLDHCHQEMEVHDMRFHKSWHWLMAVVKRFSEVTDGYYDTATLSADFGLDNLVYGDFKKSYKAVLKAVKQWELDTDRVYEEATDYFYSINTRYNTYSLSDCVDELAEVLSEEEGFKLISERNRLKLLCDNFGIDFHQISCSVGREFLDAEEAKEQLEEVVRKAEDAFWQVVSKNYSEIESGDLDPMTHNHFADSCESVVKEWLKQNTNS